MCLIMVQNSENNLNKKEFDYVWSQNPHGAGFMWSDGKKLRIKKFLKCAEAWSCYEKIVTLKRKGPIVIHWRWATHGDRNLANCHPFATANGEVAVAHNGILEAEDIKGMSDTRVWIETVLFGRSRKNIMDIEFCEHQEEYLGTSKLVFLDYTGDYRILNEYMGLWMGQDWFSNGCLLGEDKKCHIPVKGNTITGYGQSSIDDDAIWEESLWQRESREAREARQDMLDYVRSFTDDEDATKKKG